MQEIYKALLGQGGALVLACLILYQVMSMYDKLIQDMIQDNKEDRAMYQKNMSELSEHMDKVNVTLEKIQRDISSIREQQRKE